MNTDRLLHILTEYNPLDSNEAAMLKEAVHFVRSNPDCAERTLLAGHLTASAWILNSDHTRVLLTLHRKLNKWLQLGGHADGELDLTNVALREAQEESGLQSVRLIKDTPFDVDVHVIPEKGGVPQHLHYDVRFLFTADESEPLVMSDESHDLQWVTLDQLKTDSAASLSLQRMISKTIQPQ